MQLQRIQSKHLSSKTMHCSSDCTENQETYLTWLLLKIVWAFQITCLEIPSSGAAQPNFFASTPKSSNSTSSPSAVPLILWLQVFLKSATAPREAWQHLLMWQKLMLSPLLDLAQIQIALQPLFILSKLLKPSVPWAAVFGFTLAWVSFLRGRRGSFYTAAHHYNNTIQTLILILCMEYSC